MENRFVKALVHILYLLIGFLLSFFVLFNFMFTDSGSIFERAASFGITAIIYGIIGAIGAFIMPRTGKTLAAFLSLPALFITVAYSFREAENLWLNLIYFLIAAAFAFLGAYLGRNIKAGRKTR